ncbi:CpsD/CapB family tyrosine-protein kinase [Lihuaxuella thermophila]|uniref:non-specific protein-tyrosine kinase n=1 Tax=Lihuaxuella thermophila TaxID=1173111 RepID=A0A1H8CGR4_9BACL|nr:CpsD/CapB family tyrosine-protein kinase [Lihuaxuella thermophila]SEM93624.1 capsular exopolysaccharide family [Lihuaxuella thermophila]
MKDREAAGKLICLYNPKSPIAEAFRTLRTNIQFTAMNRGIKTIMITSALPGEGKSTIISNLAVAMAQSGKQVLLIDADFRRPDLHHIFRMPNNKGLSNVLMNQAEAGEVISEVPDIWLDVITSGQPPSSPADLIGSRRMQDLLEEVKEQYDVIFIDTPPILAVTDPQLLASFVDGVLLVISSGKVSYDDAKKVKAMLEYVKANLIGTVLNDKEVETIAYY